MRYSEAELYTFLISHLRELPNGWGDVTQIDPNQMFDGYFELDAVAVDAGGNCASYNLHYPTEILFGDVEEIVFTIYAHCAEGGRQALHDFRKQSAAKRCYDALTKKFPAEG
ncbi:hypothetical protein DV711_06350 [Motiliproteus coralliicola]|uniref:Uncharacterized protein n=1 Tax=Motiliproteus coralliicola TaxID=2283196 RepID=A0A369WXB9_9GAMM|nr:hypothetical protein [Motiliproteus coralliicola]RDE25174.1 hypothetical protein DV711_06350 [Motiliproteus coralliicola]